MVKTPKQGRGAQDLLHISTSCFPSPETSKALFLEPSSSEEKAVHCKLDQLEHTKAKPQAHRASNLKLYVLKMFWYSLTSERKLLNVGLIMSVLVILTLEEKAMSISVSALDIVLKSFACVCVVLQGRGQSDTRLPSIISAIVLP